MSFYSLCKLCLTKTRKRNMQNWFKNQPQGESQEHYNSIILKQTPCSYVVQKLRCLIKQQAKIGAIIPPSQPEVLREDRHDSHGHNFLFRGQPITRLSRISTLYMLPACCPLVAGCCGISAFVQITLILLNSDLKVKRNDAGNLDIPKDAKKCSL